MKKNTVIRGFFALCLLLVSSQVIGQNKVNYEEVNDKWTLIAKQEGVNIYVMQTECKLDVKFKPSTWLFYKIENTTNQNKEISFIPTYAYEEGCVNCGDTPEYTLAFSLNANETLEGNCSFSNRRLTYCVYNPNLPGGWTLTEIELNQLKIK